MNKGIIKAEIVLDSYGLSRLTTFKLTLPKALLAELNTHRSLSKGAASSRAIPVVKFQELPSWFPIRYGLNQSGMQAKAENLSPESATEAEAIWEDCINYCKNASAKLSALGLHKQWANRPNDWHAMVDDLATGTKESWDWFINLRYHPAAQPEMYELARQVKHLLDTNEPQVLFPGQWHLPWVTQEEKEKLSIEDQLIVSTARSCRVSYNNHGGNRSTLEEDKRTYAMLGLDQNIEPKHSSPAEHAAQVPYYRNYEGLGGNLGNTWVQYRKLIEKEIPVNPAGIY